VFSTVHKFKIGIRFASTKRGQLTTTNQGGFNLIMPRGNQGGGNKNRNSQGEFTSGNSGGGRSSSGNSGGGSSSRSEAARKGGESHSKEHMREIGRKGGQK
jgi:hypothetical protein